jgi:hypothetical protein
MFDGNDFLVVWTDNRDSVSLDYDLYGARVSTGGARLDSFRMVVEPGAQREAVLEKSSTGPSLLLFSGWAGTVAGREYNAQRVWVKAGPFPGVADEPGHARVIRPRPATIVRGSYSLSGIMPAALLDVSGRIAGRLVPGENDLSRFSPGVYFLSGGDSRPGSGKLLVR